MYSTLVDVSDNRAEFASPDDGSDQWASSHGVSGLVSRNAAVKFTVAQTIALEDEKLTVPPFFGTKVTLSDTGANIAILTASQIGPLAVTGFRALRRGVKGGPLASERGLGHPVGRHRKYRQACHAQIAGLGALRVTQIQATDTTVKLTVSQANALESANIPIVAAPYRWSKSPTQRRICRA